MKKMNEDEVDEVEPDSTCGSFLASISPPTPEPYLDTIEFSANAVMPWRFWLVWKVVGFIISLFVMSYSISTVQNAAWLVFLTHWCVMAVNVYFFLSIILTGLVIREIVAAERHKQYEDALFSLNEFNPHFKRLSVAVHLAQTFGVAPSLAASFVFWVGIFPTNGQRAPSYIFATSLVHGVTAIVITFDAFANGSFIPWKDSLIIIAYVFVYYVFTGIHYGSGAGNGRGCRCIYDGLDWGLRPGQAVTTAISTFLVFTLIQLILTASVNKLKKNWIPNMLVNVPQVQDVSLPPPTQVKDASEEIQM